MFAVLYRKGANQRYEGLRFGVSDVGLAADCLGFVVSGLALRLSELKALLLGGWQ